MLAASALDRQTWLLPLNRSGRARKLNSDAAHSLCLPMSSKNRSFVEGFSHR
jgi:hypothetical protein